MVYAHEHGISKRLNFVAEKHASNRHSFQLAKHGFFPTEHRACRHIISGPDFLACSPFRVCSIIEGI